jgi:hypothetical protein
MSISIQNPTPPAAVCRRHAHGGLPRPQEERPRLLTARADKPLDAEPAKVEALINGVVAEMFAKYPTR